MIDKKKKNKKLKYNNKPTYRIINNESVRFDSLKEAKRFDILHKKAKDGEITQLTLQPKYFLLDTLRVDGHKTMQKRYYNADFRYINNKGETIVEDVKSVITKKNSTYTLKKHLFLAKYGHELIFKEV